MPICTLCPDEATDGYKRCTACRLMTSQWVAAWRAKQPRTPKPRICQRHPGIALVNGGCRRCVAITGHVGRKAA